jgi:hypothetical protein
MMLPREHGAYGQLFLPLATAIAIGRPTVAALALAVAGVAAFMAHEPLLVLLGQRGARAAREEGARASRWLVATGAIATGAVVGAILVAPPAAVVALLLPAALAAGLAVVVAAHREHTTAGEMLAALALSSFALPVGVAAGVSSLSARTVVVVYALVFATATVSVRAAIAARVRARAGPSRTAAAALVLAGLAALALASQARLLDRSAPWTALPVCLVGMLLAARPPASRRLRKVGWTLVAASALTAAALIASLR